MAAQNDIYLDQGADWSQGIIYANGSGPVNITGYTFECQIRTSSVSTGGVIAASPSVDISDAANGAFTVQLTSEQTWSIPMAGKTGNDKFPTYVYDLFIISPTGQRTKLLYGNVFVSPGVSE